MTEIIIKKRQLQQNEFAYSPISSFNHQTLKELFDYIDRYSNLKIVDVSKETIGGGVCFRVIDKTADAINEEIEF